MISQQRQARIVRGIIFWLPILLATMLLAASVYRAIVASGENSQLAQREEARLEQRCMAAGLEYATYYENGMTDAEFDVPSAQEALSDCFKKGKPTSPPGGWQLSPKPAPTK